MKKTVCLVLVLLLVSVLAMPVMAAPHVVFASGSSYNVGGTMTVDIEVMAEQDAGIFEAFLERKVTYTWYKNDCPISGSNSPSKTFTEADIGSQFYVVVQCGMTLTSEKFTVPRPTTYPTITTKELPVATAGAYYEFQIKCADDMAVFELYRSPDFHKTGLSLSASGLLTGTPKEVGVFHFNVMVTGIGGDVEYGSYDFTVVKAAEVPEIKTTTLPKATVGEKYYTKLSCTDPDATFHEYYNPSKANDLSKTGLVLTQHGELEGTPKAAGSYTFTIFAAGEGGEGYRTLTLVVEEKAEEETEPVETTEAETEPVTEVVTTEATTETEEVTQQEQTTETVEKNTDKGDDGVDLTLILLVVLIVVVVVAATVIVLVIVSKKKK